MRTDILDKKEVVLQWIKEGQSKAFMCKQLLCKPETLNSYLKKMGIEYKGRQDHSKGKKALNYIPALDYIQTEHPKSAIILQKMLREGIKAYRCEICGNSEWLNQPIPLELHHIDCNHFNNSFENLQILCPNCHAMQNGNSGANRTYAERIKEKQEHNFYLQHRQIKKVICPICNINEMNSTSKMCMYCKAEQSRKANRPSREELKALIRNKTFVEIGRMFGVTDNAIRKWCDAENLPKRKSEIKQYSNEEWEEI